MISIQISVDERLARKVRPVAAIFTTWRVLALVSIALLLALPLSLRASKVEDEELTAFMSGQPASASAVNTNFQALQAAVNDNHQRLSVLEGKNLLPSAQGIHAYAVVKGKLATPTLDASYNSTGLGANSVMRSGALGGYVVTFPGLTCHDSAGVYQGMVNVSRYSETGTYRGIQCGLIALALRNNECQATIKCRDKQGNFTDIDFAVEYWR